MQFVKIVEAIVELDLFSGRFKGFSTFRLPSNKSDNAGYLDYRQDSGANPLHFHV